MRFAVVFMLLAGMAHAQTNEGLDFWFGFMEHRDVGQNAKVVMITSKYNTGGWVRIPGLNWEQSFQVAANNVSIISLPTSAETLGSETVTNTGIRVEAYQPVSVYIHQYHAARSEATVVLPVESLGKEYYAITYEGVLRQGLVYPSELLLVGMEDDTEISLTVSAATRGGHAAGETIAVTLDAGQTYQVQGKSAADDLTGSYARGTKKFNLLAGASWTEVPTGCEARDNLLEQMNPVSTWGKQFVTAPFAHMAYDIFRLLASEDNTQVTVAGASATTIYTLHAGEFVEYTRSEPTHITATHPIAAAQYLIGSGCSGHPVGDPAMLILNSIEQIRDTVTLYNSKFEAITENYINVITRTADVPLLQLDGQAPGALAAQFTPLAAHPEFSYAQLAVGTGAHTLVSGGCGVIATAYGYGQVESYAYGGGAAFRALNANPIPEGGCLNDTIVFDSGLRPPRFTFQWDLGDGHTSTEPAFEHRYSSLGSYAVHLIVEDQCLNRRDTLQRTLLVTLRQAAAVGGDTLVCQGEPVQLYASDLPGARYTWTGPNGFFSAEQSPRLSEAQPPHTGQYAVTGNISGCATYPATLPLTVIPTPRPDLGPDTLLCSREANNSLLLSPGNFPLALWSDGRYAPTLEVRAAGVYSVQVYDAYGCTAADTVRVREVCPTRVYFPNAFSPNDDGLHDLFRPEGVELLGIHLRIYDRWGGLLFESRDPNAGWDGACRGKPMPPGVYAWLARVDGQHADGSLYSEWLHGDLTLIR